MKVSRRTSYMISGWIETAHLTAGDGGTACLTIGCPDDFYAVRLGFPNISSQAWRLSKVIGCAADSFNDFVRPSTDCKWIPFKQGKSGSEPTLNVDGAGTDEIVVGPRLNPDTTDVAWTWTDWAPIASGPASANDGLRVLFLRGLVPSGQTISYAAGQMRAVLGNTAVNNGFETFIGGIKFDFDRVNDLISEEPRLAWLENQLVTGSVFPIVQFLTRSGGLTGLVVGDSHQQGTSTTEQFTGFAYRAVTKAMWNHLGSIPLGLVNAAVGGLTSAQSFRRMLELIDEVQPAYAILPGWSYNDEVNGVRAGRTAMEQLFARLLMAIEHCEARGVQPVILTPFPRDADSMGPEQTEPWRWLRSEILEMARRGATVIDATALLGQPSLEGFDATYRSDFTTDQMHPDDAGHSALGDLLVTLLEAVCRTPGRGNP